MVGYMTVEKRTCDRCGYEWIPREAERAGRMCPNCKSLGWNGGKDWAPRRRKKYLPPAEDVTSILHSGKTQGSLE